MRNREEMNELWTYGKKIRSSNPGGELKSLEGGADERYEGGDDGAVERADECECPDTGCDAESK